MYTADCADRANQLCNEERVLFVLDFDIMGDSIVVPGVLVKVVSREA